MEFIFLFTKTWPIGKHYYKHSEIILYGANGWQTPVYLLTLRDFQRYGLAGFSIRQTDNTLAVEREDFD